jgi:hypothetical protein
MQLFWSSHSLIAWRRFMAIVVGAVLVITPIGCAYRGGIMVTPAAAHASTKPATVLFSSDTLTMPGGSRA